MILLTLNMLLAQLASSSDGSATFIRTLYRAMCICSRARLGCPSQLHTGIMRISNNLVGTDVASAHRIGYGAAGFSEVADNSRVRAGLELTNRVDGRHLPCFTDVLCRRRSCIDGRQAAEGQQEEDGLHRRRLHIAVAIVRAPVEQRLSLLTSGLTVPG